MSTMLPSRERVSRADLALIGITALWGSTFVVVHRGLAHVDPMTFVAMRYSAGALVVACIARRKLFDAALWRDGVVLGVILFLGSLSATWGLVTIDPTKSAFITSLSVVLVPILVAARRAFGARGERLTTASVVAVALALVGLWLLTGVSFDTLPGRGELLSLLCAVLFAVHIVVTGLVAKSYSPVALTCVQLTVAAVLAHAARPFCDTRFENTPVVWASALFAGIVASGFAMGVQIWGQARTSSVKAAVIYSLEPLFTVLLGIAIGGALPTPREGLGGTIMIAAVIINELASPAEKREAANPAVLNAEVQ